MATVHIDELSGIDSADRGTPESPYQSLGYAIFDSPDAAKYLVRKDPGGEYTEPTQSSLKKAKKTADGLEKKKKKAEEIKEREAAKDSEEKEKREKLLEESKKIVLVEDGTLPPSKRVRHACFLMSIASNPRTGQNFPVGRVQVPAREGVRLDSSLEGSEGNYIHRPQRWHWIPPVLTIWKARLYFSLSSLSSQSKNAIGPNVRCTDLES